MTTEPIYFTMFVDARQLERVAPPAKDSETGYIRFIWPQGAGGSEVSMMFSSPQMARDVAEAINECIKRNARRESMKANAGE